MGQARHDTGDATAARTMRLVLRFALRAALLTLPRLALRAMLRPRGQSLSDFSDRQLGDIGLTRADVARPYGRPSSAGLDMERLLRGRDWR